MRVVRLTAILAEADVEAEIGAWLPSGYALRDLRLRTDGAAATLITPLGSLDLAADCETHSTELRARLRAAAKWVPLPSFLIARALELLAAGRPGVRVEGTALTLDWRVLLASVVAGGELRVAVREGELAVEGLGISV